jgi:hypothetical protein
MDPAEEPPMPQAPVETVPTRDEQHEEAHEELSESSWAYWLNSMNMKTIEKGALAAVVFLREHALEIGAAAVVAVMIFEMVQLAQRNAHIKANA